MFTGILCEKNPLESSSKGAKIYTDETTSKRKVFLGVPSEHWSQVARAKGRRAQRDVMAWVSCQPNLRYLLFNTQCSGNGSGVLQGEPEWGNEVIPWLGKREGGWQQRTPVGRGEGGWQELKGGYKNRNFKNETKFRRFTGMSPGFEMIRCLPLASTFQCVFMGVRREEEEGHRWDKVSCMMTDDTSDGYLGVHHAILYFIYF